MIDYVNNDKNIFLTPKTIPPLILLCSTLYISVCFPDQSSSQPVNAFAVLVTPARDAVGKDLPTIVNDPKVDIDKLNNEVLKLKKNEVSVEMRGGDGGRG